MAHIARKCATARIKWRVRRRTVLTVWPCAFFFFPLHRSVLLCHCVSPLCLALQANLEYMFKKFGFYLPDSEYLKDPEGLLKYLVG